MTPLQSVKTKVDLNLSMGFNLPSAGLDPKPMIHWDEAYFVVSFYFYKNCKII